ncbi:MAG: hemerythrin domain-containing protein [Muribaculaceae bacterium]|nr:hemerythrin domain-containing protein [Muribaculaceae bacterium]
MVKIREYNADDKMISLISNDYRLLQVLSRFGIPLGFSDKTIREVCNDEGVDCNTFLSVVNFLNGGKESVTSAENLSLPSLLHYLKQSHIYFLDFYLPSIRRKLLDGITLKDSDVSFLIIKLFDEYVDSIREHMEEEERHLFKHVECLTSNSFSSQNDFPVYSRHHEEVGSKLRELKNIIIKYCPPDSSANLLNAALYDIYRCEEELDGHCRIEDELLLPAMNQHIKKLS